MRRIAVLQPQSKMVGDLKRDLLFFDHIHICFPWLKSELMVIDAVLKTIGAPMRFFEFNKATIREIEFLISKGLVSDIDFRNLPILPVLNEKNGPHIKKMHSLAERGFLLMDEDEKIDIWDKYKTNRSDFILSLREYFPNEIELGALSTRFASLVLEKANPEDQYFPYLADTYRTAKKPDRRNEIIRVVLRKLPIPHRSVSWDEILDFRADPETKNKYLRLKDWLNSIFTSGISIEDFEDRIDFHINDHEEHLRKAKIKFEYGAIELLLISTAEIIENLFKLKFSTVMKKIFCFGRKEMDLEEAEIKAPGREIAYISSARSKFENLKSPFFHEIPF